MDEAVLKYYRKLLRSGFEHAGSFDNPSVFLESRGKGGVCGRASDFMHVFINVVNGRIDGMRYMCTCDPTANVAIELLCSLAKDKSLDEAKTITEDSVLRSVETESEELRNKARGLLQLLSEGLTQYQIKTRDRP